MTLRRWLKSALERGAVSSGATYLSRRRRRGDTLILAYHNVVPDGAPVRGDRSLHLPQRMFGMQLDLLRATHDIVPLAEALADILTPAAEHAHERGYADRQPHLQYPHGISPRRPRAVITFDDAYRGTVTAGVAELRARNLSATIFVPPAYVGGETFWWDVLTPDGADGLPTEIRTHALEREAGQQARVLRWATSRGASVSTVPDHTTCASTAELAAALDSHPPLTVGAHTWSHPNLAQLASGELEYELTAPRRWLEERFPGRTVAMLSYPYGRATPLVWDAMREAGYDAGFMIDGGWVTRSLRNRYAIPRLNVPAGVSAEGFMLRMAGLVAR